MALKTRLKLRIRTKMILTLSGLSLLPLILFMIIWYFTMKNLDGKVEARLIEEAKKDLARLVEDQASITNAMLDKIKTETHMMSQLAADLWIGRNVEPRRSYSSYSLAPDVSINNKVRTELKQLGNLDDFFVTVHKNDPNLFRTYIATESGVFRGYPWDLATDAPLLFSLDVRLEDDLKKGKIPQDLQRRLRLSSNAGISFPAEEGISEWLITDLYNEQTYSIRKEGDELRVYDETDAALLTIDMNSKGDLRDGKIPHGLKEQLEAKGIKLSPDARVSFSAKGKEKWLITDEDNGRVYSVREEESMLNIYEEYDPRIRPWYMSAKKLSKGEVSWEKYINWSAEGVPFSIELEFEDALNKKVVTPKLLQSFEKADRPLSGSAAVSIEKDGVWHVMNNWSYTIRKGDTLNIYDDMGAKLFDIVLEFENDLNKKVVTPELRQRFRKEEKTLSENATVSVEEDSIWCITDKGKIYTIKKEDALNVYNAYILTCSEPVFAPDGKNIGVVAADITLDAVSRRIIRTPENVEGYAFLMDQDGNVIDQEKSDMCIPTVEEDAVKKIYAGESQIVECEKGVKNYVAYAPITCMQSSVNSSPWVLGIVMEEKEMIRVAESVKRSMNYTQVLLISLFIAILLAVSDIAYRMSRRITKPILDLDEGAKIVGSGNLDYQLEVGTGDEIEDLANAFNKMTSDLKAYMRDLEETTAARERIQSELRIASEIQASMLPRTFPPFPDRKEFDIFATMEPAKEVGGDFYDFFFIDEDKLCFLIGDVSGKGVPAALFMAISRILLKTEALRVIPPDEILYNVNNTLCPDNDASMFVTLFCVILNAETGEMQFANAGHNPPLINANGEGFEFIQLPKSFVVGPMPDTKYKFQKLTLRPNDTIFLYTDGVTEAMNPDSQLFSDERLKECLSGLKDKDVKEIISAVREQIAEFAQGALQSDDITMLALKYNG
jgi:sigma-B regulation protein RsbU (phosphoserine phosphatase)